MTTDTVARLTRLVGEPCLRYLLALRQPQEAEAQLLVDDLTTEQATVLRMLGDAMPFDLAGDDSDFQTKFEIARRLGQYVLQAGCSWAVALRRASGGTVDDMASEDAVLRGLLPQLRDIYPIMLLPRTLPFEADIISSLHGHPTRESAHAAILADPDLGRLFPEGSERSGPSGSYLGPNVGGTMQLWALPAQLLTTAFDWARLDSEVPPLHAVASRLTDAVDLVRRAVRGETVTVPARIALAGALLPDEFAPFEIDGARIRRRDARDDWLVAMTGGDRSVSATVDDQRHIEISYAGDVVIETTMDYRIRLGERTAGKWPSDLSRLRQSLHDLVEAIRLGLALTDTQDDPVLVLQSWAVTLDPLSHGPNIRWSEVEQNRKLVPRQLTVADVQAWRGWTERLLAQDTSNVAIATRRVLQAIGERQMLDDVLIDSIMAWENLFGAEQETTFRVCGSLAWLLADDVAERKTLMRELKKIYALRSRIVHGSASLGPADHAASRRALRVSLDALRAILQHRPDLLTEVDGPARSNRVLLGD